MHLLRMVYVYHRDQSIRDLVICESLFHPIRLLIVEISSVLSLNFLLIRFGQSAHTPAAAAAHVIAHDLNEETPFDSMHFP